MTDKIRYRTWQHPSFKHLNGYVGIPKEHPLYEKDYGDSLCGHSGCYLHTPEALIDVHGGITYAGWFEKEDHRLWWFGFDTGHSSDDPRYGGTFKDEAYVVKECEKLMAQLRDWKGAKP